MTKMIFDSYAWIEYLDGTEQGEKVKELLEDENNEIYTCVLSVAELTSKLLRKNKDPLIALNAVNSLSKILDIDSNICFIAGQKHAEIRKNIEDFGLVDSFIITLSEIKHMKILTGDVKHFRHLENVILLE